MKMLLNIIWLVLAGIWLAAAYLLAAILLAITIIGLPFAKQSLKLARYALWPFGWALVQSPTRYRRSAWSGTSSGSSSPAGGSRSATSSPGSRSA